MNEHRPFNSAAAWQGSATDRLLAREIAMSGARAFSPLRYNGNLQYAIDAAYEHSGFVPVPSGQVFTIKRPLVLRPGVSLIGVAPVPFHDWISPRGNFSAIALAPGSNCPMLQNDRINGPIQQGNQRWQRSSVLNIHFFGSAFSQTGGDCVGWDLEEMWGLNTAGCLISLTRSHAIRARNVNCWAQWRTHAFLDNRSEAGSNCMRLDDIADSDLGDGCMMGGSPGSVVRIKLRDAGPAFNNSWFFKLRDGFFFNSLGGDGVEVTDCPDSVGIQIMGNRLDQNFRHGLSASGTPRMLIANNVAWFNGFNNPTPHEDYYLGPGCDGTQWGPNIGTVLNESAGVVGLEA